MTSETRQQPLARARASLGELRELVEGSLDKISQQNVELEHLRAAIMGEAPVAVQRKTMSKIMVHNMAMLMLRDKMGPLLPQLEGSIAEVMTDLRTELDEYSYLSALVKTAEVVNSTLDVSEVLEHVMDIAIELTGAECGYLMLLDEDSGELEYKVARNLDRETISSSSFQISRTIVKRVASNGEAVKTTDAQEDPRFKSEESVVGFNLRSILCVPLKVKDKTIGVIYAENRLRTGLFTNVDRNLLSAFANEAAVAIENAKLFEGVTQAKNLMQNIFASITSGVITIGSDDRIALFNTAAEKILGVSADNCLQVAYTKILNPVAESFTALVEQVKKDHKPITAHEMESVIMDRGEVNLSVNLAPLIDDNMKPYGVAIVVNDVTERKRFERERSMVKRYLPSQLVDSLADLKELRLGGARQEVSIFFGDIRGFTGYSEVHDATEVVDAINTIFSLVHQTIRLNNGIVDKYMGDAVMAHYNTPLLPQKDHAWLAVKTAWAAQEVLRKHRVENPTVDELHMGIGVNTGHAVAGNIGASDHMDYTLMGDAVNLAKRLQENAKPLQILVSQRTYELVRDRVLVNKCKPLKVKGRIALEQVYELTGLRELVLENPSP